MPIYEYVCQGCEARIEVKQKLSDPPLTTCERCGQALTKVISVSGIMFKGSGWYVTDYSDKMKPPSEARDASPDGQPSGAESKPGEAKAGESKPGESKPGEPKPAETKAAPPSSSSAPATGTPAKSTGAGSTPSGSSGAPSPSQASSGSRS